MYSLSWSIVLSPGQYTLNKHVTSFFFWKTSDSTHLVAFQHNILYMQTRCVSSWATLLVNSVGEKTLGREYLKCNLSVSVPVQWEVFDFWILFDYYFLGFNVPSLLTADSGMFRQQQGLLGDWVLTFDSILWLKKFFFFLQSQWMWRDFKRNHFFVSMFDKICKAVARGEGVWRCTELAHNSRSVLQKEDKKITVDIYIFFCFSHF